MSISTVTDLSSNLFKDWAKIFLCDYSGKLIDKSISADILMAHKFNWKGLPMTTTTNETTVQTVQVPGVMLGGIVQVQSGEPGLFVLDSDIKSGAHQAQADFARRGWLGMTYVRRFKGKRRYMALIGKNPAGTLIASIIA